VNTGTLDEMTRREEIQTMNMFPTIETKRLKLRELRLVDALDLFHYSSNDEVTGYYDLDSFKSSREFNYKLAREIQQ
jgi:RimJ/RimL family protein N-acetyltransferase